MSVVRAFIAIELPASAQETIHKQTTRLQESLGKDLVRWTPVHNIHITLKFLGDVAAARIGFLKQMLMRELGIRTRFDLQIGGLGSFPNSKRARILWLGLQAHPALLSMQQAIETAAVRLGHEKEERAFSPHLTIGRVKPNLGPMEFQKIHSVLESVQLGNIATASVDSVHLFKSDLKPEGSVYTKLFTAKLQTAQGIIVKRGDS
jgi:RNA 2',3'-cyclic 3'-phosphodiesterase